MNTENRLPCRLVHEGSCSTQGHTDIRKARLRVVGVGGPAAEDGLLMVAERAWDDDSLTHPADLVLIERFVTGHPTLSETRNLKIEWMDGTHYLATHDGLAIASRHGSDTGPFALVNRASPYWKSLNQALLQHQYMPRPETWHQTFIRYERQALPALMPLEQSIAPVVSFQNGRLHIATALGEVVVEGTDLRLWISQQAHQG